MSGWPISTRADISGEDSRREEKKEAGNAGNKRTKLSVGSNLFNDVVMAIVSSSRHTIRHEGLLRKNVLKLKKSGEP